MGRRKPAVEFFDATEYTGKDIYEVCPQIFDRFGSKVSIATTGVAGEMGYANSGVALMIAMADQAVTPDAAVLARSWHQNE